MDKLFQIVYSLLFGLVVTTISISNNEFRSFTWVPLAIGIATIAFKILDSNSRIDELQEKINKFEKQIGIENKS